MALNYNIYAYDAYFLQCAKYLSCPLITLDKQMKKIAQKEEVEIRRRYGSSFSLTSKKEKGKSPFDVRGIKTKVTTHDRLNAVRESRSR